MAAVVLFGGVIGPLLLMLGLVRTDAASAALLLNLEGLATMGIAWLAFRENVDRWLLLGALAILAGAVVLSWQGRGIFLDSGALLIAAACLAWGIDNNLTRKLSSADPVLIAMTKGLVAGAVNIVLAFLRGAALPSVEAAGGAAVVGFLGIGVSLVLFVLALRHLGTARTGAYFSLAPFIGALIAIVLLHDPLSIKLVLSGALMGFGLWMHLAERHEHEHVHEALEHEHSHTHDEHHRHKHDGPVTEAHSHLHRHEPLRHKHPHYPDLHHRHSHSNVIVMPPVSIVAKSLAVVLMISFGAILVAYAPKILAPEPNPAGKRELAPTQQTTSMPSVIPKPSKETNSTVIKHAGPKEVREPESDKTVEPAEKYFKKRLPNGVELNIPRIGVEAELLAFLDDKARPATKMTWFDFDRLRFDAGRTTLQASSGEQLQNIAKILVAYPSAKGIIGGHTDNVGKTDANRRLSKARADSVLRELTQMGVDASRLKAKGFGEDHPVAINDAEEGRAKNSPYLSRSDSEIRLSALKPWDAAWSEFSFQQRDKASDPRGKN